MSKRDDERYAPMFKALTDALDDGPKVKRLADIHDVAQASSKSVIALTEYQDTKIARILTVVAFLSAIVGALFTRFQTVYPWDPKWSSPLVEWAYLAFSAYVLLVALAGAVLIWAIRPTFNVPKSWRGGPRSRPRSLFFYQTMLDVAPAQWAEYWLGDVDIKARAASDYIGEAYLVAEKIARKLRVANAGVGILVAAMLVLVAFLTVSLTAFMRVAAPPSAAPAAVASPSPLPTSTATTTIYATPTPRSGAPAPNKSP